MGKCVFKLFVTVALISSISTGCIEKQNFPISKTKAYPDSTIKVQANFPIPVKGILLGTKDILKESKISPDRSGNWEDSLTLSGIAPGKNKVVVVGKPADGSKSIVYESDLEVLPYPKLSFDYDRNNVKTKQIVKVTSESNLTDVSFTLPDGTKQPFKKIDSHTYSLDTILPETDFSITVTDEVDVLETHKEHSLQFLAGKRLILNDPQNRKGSDVYTCLINDTDIISSYSFLRNIPIKDEYMKSLYKFERTDDFKSTHNNLDCRLLGISPDKRFLTGLTIDYVWTKNYSEDGYPISCVLAKYYFVYDTKTNSYHHFGTRYEKDFVNQTNGETIKEAGHEYFVVGWKDNLMLMVERTPENKFYNPFTSDAKVRNMDELNPVVPWATARGVALNLDTFELTDTDLVKPYRPWAVYADQALGIIGYTGPYDVGNDKYKQIGAVKFNHNLTGIYDSLFFTGLTAGKVHDINKVTKHANIDPLYEIYQSTLIGGCVLNNKTHAQLFIGTQEINATGEIQEGGVKGGTSRKKLNKYYIAFADVSTGQISKVCEITDIIENVGGLIPIICSDPIAPPTFLLKPGILAQLNGEKFEIISKPIPRPFVDNNGLIIR